MVRRPNLFKYLPIRLRIFNCWDAFLQISDICLSKFRWESTVMPKSLTFSSLVNCVGDAGQMLLINPLKLLQ